MADIEYEAKIDDLQKWFEENENLPKKIDRLVLRRFYQCMHEDVNETQKVIEINYSMRNKYPHLFLDRDPSDIDSQRTFEYADMVPLPGLTPEKYKITCFRLCDTDPKKVHYTEDTKAFIMITDCRFCMPDAEDGNPSDPLLAEGEVQIFDMSGYTMKHATRLTFNTIRIYMRFLQQAFPVRIRAIHMIHCPTFLDRVVSIFKPFINSEIFKMVHFHTESIESLYKYVPQELLPEEYGGNAGKLADLKHKFLERMQEKRAYLMNPDYWKIANFS